MFLTFLCSPTYNPDTNKSSLSRLSVSSSVVARVSFMRDVMWFFPFPPFRSRHFRYFFSCRRRSAVFCDRLMIDHITDSRFATRHPCHAWIGLRTGVPSNHRNTSVRHFSAVKKPSGTFANPSPVARTFQNFFVSMLLSKISAPEGLEVSTRAACAEISEASARGTQHLRRVSF